MSLPIPLEQKLEVRDASGLTVGFILSERQARELIAEREALRQQTVELREQLAAVRAEAARLATERDGYLASLHFLTRQGLLPLAEQERIDLQRDGLPFEQLLPEIEELIGRKASGG